MTNTINSNTNVSTIPAESVNQVKSNTSSRQKFSPDNIVQLVKCALGFCGLGLAGYGIYKGTNITVTKGDTSVEIKANNQAEEIAS